MAKKREQYQPEELQKAETVTTTLQELAAHFGFNNTTKFRDTVLRRNQYPYRRVSRERWQMRVKDLSGF